MIKVNEDLDTQTPSDNPEYASKYSAGRHLVFDMKWPNPENMGYYEFVDFALWEGEFKNSETFEAFVAFAVQMFRLINKHNGTVTKVTVTPEPSTEQEWSVNG